MNDNFPIFNIINKTIMMSNSTFLRKNAITGFPIFKHKNQKSTKYFYLLMLFVFMGTSICVNAQSAGFNSSFAVLSINGGGNTYYDLFATTANTDFNNADLGAFSSVNTLLLKGAEHNVYKCGGCDLTSTRLFYRIYITGDQPTSFSNIDIGWSSGFNNGCGGQDQVWSNTGYSINVLSGLPAGNYTFEVYSDAAITCSGNTALANNNGSNYKATFTVVKAESTIAVTGTTNFTYDNTPHGPSTANVTGSSGAVTYSYVGVSPTIYAANATPPTNPGTYTVTATVAADDNYNGASSSATPFTIEAGLYTYIPDANFLQALTNSATYNVTSLGACVLTSEISNLTELNIESKNISNLTGIEDFSSLQDLYCYNNNLSSLDVSMLSSLSFLDLESNSLTSLNIKGLNNLIQVICWFNNLTTLDLSDTPNLVYLDCDDNAFTSLNVSELTQLAQFYCSGNQLTSLDVRGLTNLTNFECADNLLTCILVDDVPAAILKNTTVDPDPEAQGAYLWATDDLTKYSYCACNLTTTWDGASWIPVAPTTGTYAAIIAGNYSEPANISACTLTIKNGATAIIPSGFNVALNAPLTVETGGSFTLSNNANLIQSTNTANTGNVVVKRNSNPLYRLDYTMWSSPVASQNLSAFSPLTTLTRFYTYNPATNLYNAIPDPSATNFTSGAGYLIRMPNTDPASGYDAGTNSIIYPGVFTGVPNTGNVSLASLSSGQYYAVGNPYPSPISAESFLAGNSTDGILYFWRKTNAALGSAYATYTAGGSTTTTPTSAAPNGTIAVGQGFIVKTGVTTTLNFTNAMREVSPTSTQFFKTRQVVEKDRVWLNLTNTTGVFSQMLVGYMTNATQGVDAGIDGKYINDSPIALTSNINNEEYTIQGRALPFDGTDVVPLNFKTDVAGDYTIAIDHVDGLFATGQDVYLVDSATGTETNLKSGAYTFSAAAGTANSRFALKYQKTLGIKAAAFSDNSVTVYKNKGTLHANSGDVAIANIKVFDIQGRLLSELKNVGSTSATIPNLKAANQVLVVKITSQDNKVVSKKVVHY